MIFEIWCVINWRLGAFITNSMDLKELQRSAVAEFKHIPNNVIHSEGRPPLSRNDKLPIKTMRWHSFKLVKQTDYLAIWLKGIHHLFPAIALNPASYEKLRKTDPRRTENSTSRNEASHNPFILSVKRNLMIILPDCIVMSVAVRPFRLVDAAANACPRYLAQSSVQFSQESVRKLTQIDPNGEVFVQVFPNILHVSTKWVKPHHKCSNGILTFFN